MPNFFLGAFLFAFLGLLFAAVGGMVYNAFGLTGLVAVSLCAFAGGVLFTIVAVGDRH